MPAGIQMILHMHATNQNIGNWYSLQKLGNSYKKINLHNLASRKQFCIHFIKIFLLTLNLLRVLAKTSIKVSFIKTTTRCKSCLFKPKIFHRAFIVNKTAGDRPTKQTKKLYYLAYSIFHGICNVFAVNCHFYLQESGQS